LLGNRIGTDAPGVRAVPNLFFGVDIFGSNNILGTAAGFGNLISGNAAAGVRIEPNASGNQLQHNKIGTDADGTAAVANDTGVAIFGAKNTVGGVAGTDSNLISGNTSAGVFIYTNASGNQVQGNKIGTNLAGTSAIPNNYGLDIEGSNNTVGSVVGAGNLISGNSTAGVLIEADGSGNQVLGNFIGTNADGTAALANGTGVDIFGSNNTISGAAGAGGNVISGNTKSGVLIEANASGSQVRGNKIGTNAAGTAALANNTGVDTYGSNNTVGGTSFGAGNVISGNTAAGVQIELNAGGNQVQGNNIGTNAAGTALLSNSVGVDIFGSNNTVGGTVAGAGNVISGNRNANAVGVDIEINASGNQMQGNKIGTNAAGTSALGNLIGVLIHGSNNTVGGTAAGAGNLISGNARGVDIGDLSATGNVVQGNKIGTNAAGTAALSNVDGVDIDGSNNNTVGGTAAGAGNIIAFNSNDGVAVRSGSGNAIRENSIYANTHLGIELLLNGNFVLHAPVLTSATFNTINHVLTIKGTLSSTANTTFALEFFANPAGASQGQIYLGRATVITNGSGSVSFTAPIVVTAKAFSSVTTPIITATATDPNGDTSQFSNGVHDPVEPNPTALSAAVPTPIIPAIQPNGNTAQFSSRVHGPVAPTPTSRRRLLHPRRWG